MNMQNDETIHKNLAEHFLTFLYNNPFTPVEILGSIIIIIIIIIFMSLPQKCEMKVSKGSPPNFASNIKQIWANLLTSIPPEINRKFD